MPKICDNLSVGIVIRNKSGLYALLERRKFPVGFAPVAGHIDNHGSAEQAALDEAQEELGINLTPDNLQKTVIDTKRKNNQCVREGGSYHIWTVFESTIPHQALQPDVNETKGGRWFHPDELQALADRTRAYLRSEISESDWQKSPGLEHVWLDHLTELGHIT